VIAEADTMVKQARPRTSPGTAGVVVSDGRAFPHRRSAVHSYLRFRVTGLAPGEEVTAAWLSLRTAPVSGGPPTAWRSGAPRTPDPWHAPSR
jgi:hypothetical protein